MQFEGDEHILQLIVVVISYSEYTENHWFLYTNWFNYMVSKLYVN